MFSYLEKNSVATVYGQRPCVSLLFNLSQKQHKEKQIERKQDFILEPSCYWK